MAAPADHPLLLAPHLAPRVWGGRRLGDGIGEAWDLSVHPHGPCRIRNGPLAGLTLAEAAPGDFGGPIDLLAKRLDCAQDLSVQVHPRHGDPKTEAWVVLAARPGAGVYRGFRRPVGSDEVRAAALDGTLPDLLHFHEATVGECIFLPSGTVHAIGGGLVLFELQQSSDTTYRLFDWGRDRALHLDEALACLDPAPAPDSPPPQEVEPGRTRLVECPWFHIDRVALEAPRTFDPGAKWVALFVARGRVRCGAEIVDEGGTLLIPHAAGAHAVEPEEPAELLAYGPPVTRSRA